MQPWRLLVQSSPRTSREIYRFGDFELDVTAYELRRQGRRVRLERRPMDLLVLMVQRPGELLTRTEIVERLWGSNVFIEVDAAVNTVIRKIRRSLRDSPDSPAFVETVPGKGYRFIAHVEILRGDTPASLSNAAVSERADHSSSASAPS